MLEALRSLLGLEGSTDSPENESEAEVRIATAALLTKMVRADFRVHDEEEAQLREAARSLIGEEESDCEELLRLAGEQAQESVSLYDFTSLLHQRLSLDEKVGVIELLWRVAFADGELDSHEEFLVRKVARLLHVPHAEFIAAKRRAAGTAGPAGRS